MGPVRPPGSGIPEGGGAADIAPCVNFDPPLAIRLQFAPGDRGRGAGAEMESKLTDITDDFERGFAAALRYRPDVSSARSCTAAFETSRWRCSNDNESAACSYHDPAFVDAGVPDVLWAEVHDLFRRAAAT